MALEYVNCNLCEVDHSELLFTKNNYKLVRCKKCGLIYINPRIAGERLKDSYAGDYSLGYIAKKASKRRRAKGIVKRIFKFKKQGKFLDIGCSAGFILEAAREKGFEVFGVEISPHALKFAREELKFDIFEGYLENAHFPDGFFDVITMYNLLEHVPDPAKFLKEVSRIAKEGSLIEIWTPDIGHRRARKMGSNWNNIFPEHLYYFSLDTLKRALEKAGLNIYKNQFTLKDGLKVYVVPAKKQLS